MFSCVHHHYVSKWIIKSPKYQKIHRKHWFPGATCWPDRRHVGLSRLLYETHTTCFAPPLCSVPTRPLQHQHRNKHTCTQQGSASCLHHLTCQSQLRCTVAPPHFLSLFFQKHGERRRSSTASNGFLGNTNLFPGNANLPDLVQQSTSPLVSPGDASGVQVGGVAPKYRPPLNPAPSHTCSWQTVTLSPVHPVTLFPRHLPTNLSPAGCWETTGSHQNTSEDKLV